MNSKVFDKICSVCGDKASGFHFDAITCESCKSFFRRNALKTKNLRCFLGGECKIDVSNRTFCRRCRLNKCLYCGMKTEFILTEEQRKLRKSIIEENRRRKFNINNSNDNQTMNSMANSSISSQMNDNIPVLNEISLCQTQNYTTNSFIDLSNFDLKNSLKQSVDTIQRPITDYNKTFNELEGNRLTELLNAIQYMTDPSVTCSQSICDFLDAIHVMHQKLEIDIRKLIKMSKCLTGFRAVSENDQIVMLKFSSIEIVLTQMILYFDFQFEYWNIITNDNNSNLISLELFKDKKRNTYENHKHFLQNIGKEWHSDPIIIHLLTAILLFNPNRPKLINQSIIKLQQQIYIHLLQRYLLLKYNSETESKLRLSNLMNSLTDLHILNEKIRLNCLELDLHDIPLLKEICDWDSLSTLN